jgi:ribonuclease BN (tRNA processing enzyme)
MTKVIFLGVGGAMAVDPADNHTALFVRHDQHALLLDCGPTIMRQMERIGLNAGDPTHVIVSHQHGDHALGLPMLLLNRTLFWPERPLLVLAMPPVLAVLQQLVTLSYPDLSQRMAETIEFVALKGGRGSHPLPQASGVSYATARVRHSVPTWGLRLAFGPPAGRTLVYSADTGPTPAMAELAADADVLVHDSYYLTPPSAGFDGHSAAEQAGAIAAQARIGALVLMHRQRTAEADADAYRTAASIHFAGPILTPQAGDSFTF